MKLRTLMLKLFVLFDILVLFFLIGSTLMFVRSYRDPRWRIFDFNSRQASEGDIYNVAEIPAIKSVCLPRERTLRFSFTPPIPAGSWSVRTPGDNRIISEGSYPEITFPDTAWNETFEFIPDDVTLSKDILVTIMYYPKEGYEKSGLSWPDNYFSPATSVPFSMKKPYTLDEWAGLTDNDPDCMEARRILGDRVDMTAGSLERSEQVFRFIMEKTADAGGIPTDEVQEASPLETFRMLSSGMGRGWCENRALVYYLFANAAGVKTRLVDLAGKFGPLKLTGHYFCESWSPEQHRWYLVDPQASTAYITNTDGMLLSTLDTKKLFDVDMLDGCTVLAYDRETGELGAEDVERYANGVGMYFRGEIVMAYKFGYPKNRTYSKIRHFIGYPTLLYAPFVLPRLCLVKNLFLAGFVVSLAFSVILGGGLAVVGLMPESLIESSGACRDDHFIDP